MVDDHESHGIEVHLDRLLADRGMTLAELASRVGVTNVNLSILKNGRARAIRFTTLTRICEALDCQPGDLLTYVGDGDGDGDGDGRRAGLVGHRPPAPA
ncbi:helix-turn-helix domain-containing protein [Streptomyces sp. NPDC060198]|uniref:helix-turn-helix domain-containing protein n=1 Tax=Streptomyces sp. NPDC060198 TaxID=3347070 RepID=UPI003659509E